MAVAEPTTHGVMAPVTYRVTDRVQETADTFTLSLAALHGEAPPIEPGQFMMVYAFGVGEVPISVSGVTDQGEVVLTVRAVGAVSGAICAAQPGGTLGLRGPFGSSWPLAAAHGADLLVIAGGIGLAPLRMLVRQALSAPERFASFTLLYGARAPADLLYTAELERWRSGASVAVTVDVADSDWRGHVGVVPKLIGAARFDSARAHAFLCGPEVMMDFTVQALQGRGIDSQRIHLSMERHMDCGVGLCGHCQLGPTLICRDGPVYSHAQIARWMGVREL